MKCSVINCEKKVKFRFPSNHILKKKWLETIGRPTYVPHSCHGLCIEHFNPEDIITESYRSGNKLEKVRLKRGAVPIDFSLQKKNYTNLEIEAVDIVKHLSDKSEMEFNPEAQEEEEEEEEAENVSNGEESIDKDLYINEYTLELSADVSNGRTASPSELFDDGPVNTDEDCDDNNTSDIELLPDNSDLNIQSNIDVYEEVCSVSEETSEPSNVCYSNSQDEFKDEKRSMSSQTCTVPRYIINDFKNKPRSLLHFTGLENYDKFSTVFYSLGPRVYHIKYVGKNIGDLDVPNQLFLVLWKLRQCPSDLELSEHFNVPEAAVGNIFISWITFMSTTWSYIDIWPSRELIDFYMPETFKRNYPKARVIVDETEIKTDAPSNPRQKQSSFSSYKYSPTMKTLIGGSPGGLISYFSPAYGGSTSDRQIIERSDLCTKCQPGDVVLGDKGFLVQDIFAPYDVTVATPTPLVTGSIPHKTIMKDRKLSRHRVHIERLIGLMKTFKILSKKLNHYYIPMMTEIVGVCVMLANFKENIMKTETKL